MRSLYMISLLHIMCQPCPLTSKLHLHNLYGEVCPILPFLEYPRGESQISTWIFLFFHVGVIHFFRSFISFLRRIFYSPRGDFEISTWKSLFPDTTPFRYVVGSKLLLRNNLRSEASVVAPQDDSYGDTQIVRPYMVTSPL